MKTLSRLVKLQFFSRPQMLGCFSNVVQEKRLYSTEAAIEVNCEPQNKKKLSKKATASLLQRVLNVAKIDALDIVLNHPYFEDVPKTVLTENHSLFKEKGITNKVLLQHPQILAVHGANVKITELEKLPYNLNVTATLISLPAEPFKKLIRYETRVGKEGKISFLATHLRISKEKACELIASKPFLCNLANSTILSKIRLLSEFGVSSEGICNDLWVLQYSENLIRTRLNIAKEHNIDTTKTWMVRAKKDIFQTHIQRHSDTKSILGDNSLIDYLCERLECSASIANYLITKQPVLKNKSLKKLNELIDLLYSEGFKPHHICRVPKILVHCVETIQKRLKMLEAQGIKLDTLSVLTKSNNQFMRVYESLVKNKNKKKNET